MAYGYLGDVAPRQRLMTFSEQAGFLARHPIVATEVTETKAAILAGLYDWNYYDHVYQPGTWEFKFPGIIEPIGMQVEDSVYGLVTIEPARNGEIYFSAYTGVDLNTDIETTGEGSYQPPPPACGDFLSCLLGDMQTVILAGAVVGGIYLFYRSKPR